MAKTALVLSGGGVKGLAHIGVLKYLEEIEIDITHISGASVGALVGMMYAAGLSSDSILDYFLETSILSIKNYGFGKPGFLDTIKYESELRDLIGVDRFEDLKKKLYVTTTNLFTAEEKVFQSGDIIKPVLASASFPMVFSPVEIDGEWYADGGIVNNFPVENVPLEVNHIIGVNLNFVSNIDASALTSSFAVMERAFAVMMSSKTTPKSKICSVYISDKELAQVGVFEMKKRMHAYHIGYNAAKRKHEEFVKLKQEI